MSKKVVLKLSGLSVRRSGVHILTGVDWEVKQGEHWIVLGPNGSGKTSLLAALTGYFPPSEGHIEVLGQVYGKSDWRALRQKVGIVSSTIRQMMSEDEPALSSVVSGRFGMIDLWGKPSAGDVRKARKLLRSLDCQYLENREWRVLSQGERQKVLIARALMANPAMLILDEACAGLDPVAREGFLDWLSHFAARKEAPALVMVTHHLEEILPEFPKVLLLSRGRVLKTGTQKKVLNSELLSETYRSPVKVVKRKGRYQLRLIHK